MICLHWWQLALYSFLADQIYDHLLKGPWTRFLARVFQA